MKELLKVKNVSYAYHTLNGETKALNDLTFDVFPNEFLGIIGPSGCGKSTVLSLIFGLLDPVCGGITYNAAFSKSVGAGTSIGYMLQKDHLLEWRTIYKNITLGLEIKHQLTPDKIELIHQMLGDYGLEQFADSRPSQLSGGMRQRAALIRTLALQPELLLLDEPFSALDYQTRLTVADDIFKILRKENKSAILVTHDISEAIGFCDRIIVLTPRPGSIKNIVPIELTVDDKTPFKARSAPEFKNYFNELWGELNVDAAP